MTKTKIEIGCQEQHRHKNWTKQTIRVHLVPNHHLAGDLLELPQGPLGSPDPILVTTVSYTQSLLSLYCIEKQPLLCTELQCTSTSASHSLTPGEWLANGMESEPHRPSRKWLSLTCRLTNYICISLNIHVDAKSSLTFNVQLLFKKSFFEFGLSVVEQKPMGTEWGSPWQSKSR